MPGERKYSSGLSLEGLGIEQPYSMAAEQSVLGAAILDTSCIDILIQRLRPEMFYVRQNRAVFSEILTLVTNGQPVDIVVLADRLASEAAFGNVAQARAYIAEVADTVPSLTNVPHYIEIVYEKYIKRLLMEHARDILEQSADDTDSKIMLEAAEQKLYEIRSGRDTSEVQKLKYAMLDVMTHLQNLDGPNKEDYLGIKTGYRILDKKLTGFGRTDLIILASRPGMGKSSFALNIAMNVVRRNVPAIFFSLEMTKDQLAGRILSSEALIDSYVFRTGVVNPSDWDDITNVSELIGPLPLYLDDTPGITIPEMKAKIRRVNRSAMAEGTRPVGLIVVDYLQLMSTGKRTENRVQEISEITRNLKLMAMDLRVPVLALSQLSRSAEKNRADHRPMLSDLRDSGSIEQDADVVMFLFREAYYGSGQEDEEVILDSAEVIIAKNRHGETATVHMKWDGTHTRFEEVDFTKEY